MKKINCLLCAVCLFLVSCDKQPPEPQASANENSLREPLKEGDLAPTEADVELIQLIRQKLGKQVSGINLSVSNGNVKLIGTVNTEDEKATLQEKVSTISGVNAVYNNLSVRS